LSGVGGARESGRAANTCQGAAGFFSSAANTPASIGAYLLTAWQRAIRVSSRGPLKDEGIYAGPCESSRPLPCTVIEVVFGRASDSVRGSIRGADRSIDRSFERF